MFYTDLNKIPIRAFIDVFNGDIRALIVEGEHTPEELEKTAQILIYEYIDIVGGSSHKASLDRRNSVIDYSMKIRCMEICEVLLKIEEYSQVSEILSLYGYTPTENEDQLKNTVISLLNESRLKLDRMMSVEQSKKESKMDKDYFVKEQVILMQYYKMTIDLERTSAKQYAYMVKNMVDQSRKSKSKKK